MLLAVALMLTLPAAPLAEDLVFVEGRALFDELEFEQAAIRFEQLSLDAAARPAGERAQVLTWLGVCQAKVGAFDAAKASFGLASRLDPAVRLPVEVSPVVVEMFESAQKASLAAATEPEPTKVPEPDATDANATDVNATDATDPDPTDPNPDPTDPDPTGSKTKADPAPTGPKTEADPVEVNPLSAPLFMSGAGLAVVAVAAVGVGSFFVLSAGDLAKTQVDAVELHQYGLIGFTLAGLAVAGAAGAVGAGLLLDAP